MPGRPRSETARVAILEAAGDLLLEGGLGATTIEGIAARAGVSKATIYKWWPSRGAIALDGLLARVQDSITIPEGAGTVDALIYQIDALVAIFLDPRSGPLMRAIASQVETDADMAAAVRERWLAPRRAIATQVVRAGMANGELRDDLDPELLMDMLYAPLYYRLIFGHAPLPPDLGASLVHQLLVGIAKPAL